jgi:hypothetical protein
MQETLSVQHAVSCDAVQCSADWPHLLRAATQQSIEPRHKQCSWHAIWELDSPML